MAALAEPAQGSPSEPALLLLLLRRLNELPRAEAQPLLDQIDS